MYGLSNWLLQRCFGHCSVGVEVEDVWSSGYVGNVVKSRTCLVALSASVAERGVEPRVDATPVDAVSIFDRV